MAILTHPLPKPLPYYKLIARALRAQGFEIRDDEFSKIDDVIIPAIKRALRRRTA